MLLELVTVGFVGSSVELVSPETVNLLVDVRVVSWEDPVEVPFEGFIDGVVNVVLNKVVKVSWEDPVEVPFEGFVDVVVNVVLIKVVEESVVFTPSIKRSKTVTLNSLIWSKPLMLIERNSLEGLTGISIV